MRIKKKKKHTTLLLLLLLMIPKTNSLKEVSILKSNVLTFHKAIKSPGGCCSVAKSYPTLCDPMNCNVPGFPVFYYLPRWLKLVSIELVMPSNHLILCCPLLLLPSTVPRIRAFSSESALHIRWPKYWSFSFSISISLSSEYFL